jgi:predicted O-methyltransferase YrrM
MLGASCQAAQMERVPRFPVVVPEAAAAAYAAAAAGGFGRDGPTQSSRLGTGALLAVLAASRRNAKIAELGTGLGAGAAWMATGMDDRSRLITVECDEVRASAARERLRGDPRVEVVTGRWEEVLPARGPYDLVFVDSGYSRQLDRADAADFLLDIVAPRGMLVLDDLTPDCEMTEEAVRHDAKRQFAFANPRVIGVELYPPSPEGILGGEQSGLLVMTKVG